MKLKPIGLLLGLAGNVALAWALYHLLAIGSCGGEYPPCPASATPYFLALPAGIIASMAGIFLGGGPVIFFGIFTAVGVGALLRGLNGGAGPEGDTVFPLVFGGFFMLPALAALAGIPLLRGRGRRMARLVAEGRRGIATVREVHDTGVTINGNPRVKLTVGIAPEDGSPGFEGTKAVTVSRVKIPRPGDRYPAWYDPQDPSRFGLGTDVEPGAPAEVRALFAKAAQASAEVEGEIAAVPVQREQDWVTELARLNDLRMSGALTDEEFARAKDKLLAAPG